MPHQHPTSPLPALASLVKSTPKTDLSQVAVVVCHPLSHSSEIFCHALAEHGLEVHVCATYPELYPEAAMVLTGSRRIHVYRIKDAEPGDPFEPYAKLYTALRQARAEHKWVMMCDYNGSLLQWLWQHHPPARGEPLIQGISSIRPQSLSIYQNHHGSASEHTKIPILTLPHHILHADPHLRGEAAFKATQHWITAWHPEHTLTSSAASAWNIAVVGYEDGGRAVSCELKDAAHSVMVAATSLTEQARACYDGHILLPSADQWPQDLTHLVWTYPHLHGFTTLASTLPHGATIINGSGISLDPYWPPGTQMSPGAASHWRTATLPTTAQMHVRAYPPWGEPLTASPMHQDLVYYFEWSQLFSLIHHQEHQRWNHERGCPAVQGPATLPMARQYALCAEVLAAYGEELSFLSPQQSHRLNTDGTYTPWRYRNYGPDQRQSLL